MTPTAGDDVDDAVHAKAADGTLLCKLPAASRRAIPAAEYPIRDLDGSYCWTCLSEAEKGRAYARLFGGHTDWQITGAIPAGPIGEHTEMVFVAGRAFIETSRHEQIVNDHIRDRAAMQAIIGKVPQEQLARITAEVEAEGERGDASVRAAPEGYWQRAVKAYGQPGDFFLARLYWPVADPRPDNTWTRRW